MIRCTKEEINEQGSEICERRLSWKAKGNCVQKLTCLSQTNTYAQFRQTHNYSEKKKKKKKNVVQMFVLYLCNHSCLTFGGNS